MSESAVADRELQPSSDFFISARKAGALTGQARAQPAGPLPDDEFEEEANRWLRDASLMVKDFADAGKAGCQIPSGFSVQDGRTEAYIRDFLDGLGYGVEVRIWLAGPGDRRLEFIVTWKPVDPDG